MDPSNDASGSRVRFNNSLGFTNCRTGGLEDDAISISCPRVELTNPAKPLHRYGVGEFPLGVHLGGGAADPRQKWVFVMKRGSGRVTRLVA